MNRSMKKQALNPYLPSWKYIPDGEPHVFGEGIYMVPVSVENLHSNRGSRNFWCDFFSRI
ncbi:MAG: hypothetical protein ACLRMH_13325 [Lachnospiraceae bacterium]